MAPKACSNCGGYGVVYYRDDNKMVRCTVCDGKGEIE